MFSKKQLIIILILMFASSLAGFGMAYFYLEYKMAKYLGIDAGINTDQEKDQVTGYYYQQKNIAYVGVIIPDKCLASNSEKNWKFAETFFPKHPELERHKMGPIPGVEGYTGFSFKCNFFFP